MITVHHSVDSVILSDVFFFLFPLSPIKDLNVMLISDSPEESRMNTTSFYLKNFRTMPNLFCAIIR